MTSNPIVIAIFTGVVTVLVSDIIKGVAKSQKDRTIKAATLVTEISKIFLTNHWRRLFRFVAMSYCIYQLSTLITATSVPSRAEMALISFWTFFAGWLLMTGMFGWHNDDHQ
jgi:hypothetical protein